MLKYVFLIGLLSLISCQQSQPTLEVEGNQLHDAMQKLTDVIVHDIFSPPVASRIYAYPSIAAYEVLASQDSVYFSLVGQVNGLEPIPAPEVRPINYEVAAVQAFLLVGRQLIFSEDQINAYIESWHDELDEKGMSPKAKANSLLYAEQVSKHIMTWASRDNYNQTRTYEKYSVGGDSSTWKPTPPAYIEAIEPYWNRIRPFVLDSANQFSPEKPSNFSLDKESDFYKETMEVYETGNNLSKEQVEIASFWDCNPFVMNVTGHVMFATKKITPGGHWIGIAKTACKITDAKLTKAAQVYATISIVLTDAFISCWDEKYRSNLIRPETVINQYIDEDWKPLLQTPPFPEYTSGHSVISGAAGEVLTSIFGKDFQFTDSTEVKYGLPPRDFNSFNEASGEAAISRLYGGIHYTPAIDNGLKQGRLLGRFMIDNLKTQVLEGN